MPKKGQTEDPDHPEWWDEGPDKAYRNLWQQAVADYLIFHSAEPEHVKFTIDLVKLIIPHVAVRDQRWANFPKASFDIQQHEAHM